MEKVSTTNPSGGSSYGQILRSSSIIGGAQAINYVIGLVRTKVVAVLLGPSGVGLVGLYVSAVGLVQTFAQFGINQSGVREVAAAAGSHDERSIAQTIITLRRVCWFTGIFGWGLTVGLAWPLSQWVFGSGGHVWALAALGIVVLLELLSSGQKALLQGARRVGDLARLQIAFALLSTIAAVALYWWLGEEGIVPVIILTSVVQLCASWWFARKIAVVQVTQSWQQTWINSKALFRLGSAFMYGALLTALAGLAIRSLINRDLGIEAAGIYQAAWALSGLFGAFVLQAMGTDFYPRLTAVSSDDCRVKELVNEQIEMGILLALPGLLFAVPLAPWLIVILYSREFLEGALLMPWFFLGVLGQLIGWPLAIIPMARAAARYIYAIRTSNAVLQLGLAIVFIESHGLVGAAYAFAIFAWLQNALLYLIARRLCAFTFSPKLVFLIVGGSILLEVSIVLVSVLSSFAGAFGAALIGVIASCLCLHRISQNAAPNNRTIKAIAKMVARLRRLGPIGT